MEKKIFEKLLSSTKQASRISKGKARPSRRYTFKPEEVAKIRNQLNLSQNKFAELLRVPAATLRNWEQGRTTPDAPAQTLLLIAHKRPDVLGEVVGEKNIVYGRSRSSIRPHKPGRSLKPSTVGKGKLKKAAKKKIAR